MRALPCPVLQGIPVLCLFPALRCLNPFPSKVKRSFFIPITTSKWELFFFFLIQIIYFRDIALSLVHEKPKLALLRETSCPTAPLIRLQAAQGGEALSLWSPVLHCMVRKAGTPSSPPSSPEGKPFFPGICFIQTVSWGKDSD